MFNLIVFNRHPVCVYNKTNVITQHKIFDIGTAIVYTICIIIFGW